MIWALLIVLGIPFWFIVGILGAIWWSRRSFKQQPGVFEIAIRADNATKWPRQLGYGRLVRDVLVINRGVALLRTEMHGVDMVSEFEIGDGPKKPVGAVGRLIALDDGSRREVAVSPNDVALLDAVSAANAGSSNQTTGTQ
ncbi:MAG: hypothetical protein OEW83_03065 [Acidimicrobiia bacterium]|nr:hypothetical protein [Acidimicrobiia bacterium]